MSMTETIGSVKITPLHIWQAEAKGARKSATKHFADALVMTDPVIRAVTLGLSKDLERYAATCEARASELQARN